MDRTKRIALLAAATLVVAVAGAALANRAPVAEDVPAQQGTEHEPEAPPTAEELAHARDRLADNEITIDEAVFNDLAARYGVGGAVRIAAWSAETGMAPEDIARMHDGTETEPAMGWGRIAHDLIAHDLGVHPGIGSIMGNGKAGGDPPGLERAPGQSDE